ncbi:MAG: XisI protein [Cyanobacteriota bacterium]|nr:XisI protein [Cyanobacteriota bacterium]
MEKIERYRAFVQQILEDYASLSPDDDEVNTERIFDTERDHYQIVYAGWKNRRRMYGCVLHLDIKDGKIWVQHDGTEIGMADELVKLGVPKEDIVLAFQEPLVRPYTGFAVG